MKKKYVEFITFDSKAKKWSKYFLVVASSSRIFFNFYDIFKICDLCDTMQMQIDKNKVKWLNFLFSIRLPQSMIMCSKCKTHLVSSFQKKEEN